MNSKDPARQRTRLYLITPPRIDDVSAFADEVEAALSGGDIGAFQLRLKQDDNRIDKALTEAVHLAVKDILAARDVAVIINDDPHLAVDLGADGVHLGHEDMLISAARNIVGPEMIIGATAKNSRHVAMLAGEAGADYVAFGAFYPTKTKTDTVEASSDLLTVWQDTMALPCVAIGGITTDTAEFIARAGADFIAVSSAVWGHEDGAKAAVQALNLAIDRAFPE